MQSTIESALAAQYLDDRIRGANASRQARVARQLRPAGPRGLRWFRRLDAVVTTGRPLQSGR
jgi:hypothetical protein